MAISPTLSSQTSLSRRCKCRRPAFSPEPISESTSVSTPLRSVAAQACRLRFQIRFLSMSADPGIQHQETPIEFAYHPFNLGARDTDLAAHGHHLNTTGFNPTPNGDGMSAQFMGSNTQA